MKNDIETALTFLEDQYPVYDCPSHHAHKDVAAMMVAYTNKFTIQSPSLSEAQLMRIRQIVAYPLTTVGECVKTIEKIVADPNYNFK